jgi:hypothetical protein
MRQISSFFLLLLLLPPSVKAQITPTPGAAGDLEQRFRLADRNRDDALSRSEAAASGWFGTQVERFESLDTDRSGTVTLAEIAAGVHSQVESWMRADIDRDGRITAEEAQRQPDSVGRIFSEVDSGEGAVTREELESFSQRGYYQHGDLPAVAPNIIERRF